MRNFLEFFCVFACKIRLLFVFLQPMKSKAVKFLEANQSGEHSTIPCFNFYQQLLWHRERIEVLEPLFVRMAMKDVIEQMLKLY